MDSSGLDKEQQLINSSFRICVEPLSNLHMTRSLLPNQHDDADDGGATDDDKELGNVDKSFEVGLKLARGHRTVCLECFAPEGTPIQASP